MLSLVRPRSPLKSTNSLDVNDLPKAILALQKAFEYLALSPEPPEGKGFEDGGGE